MVCIALDTMGCDGGPAVVISAAASLSLDPRCPRLVLVGDRDRIAGQLATERHRAQRISVEHTEQVVAMHDSPQRALEAQPNASVAVAARLVADGRADAMVSAGNTGAVLLAAARHIGRLDGVHRAALAAVYPTARRRGVRSDPFALMLDVGATLEVEAEELVAFAIMGSAYATLISDNPSPSVALLSNGSEPGKGTKAVVRAHELLRRTPGLRFIGNIEGVDIPRGTADVIVTGGFVGNVVLKMLEGISETVLGLARYAYRRHLSWRLALWTLSSGIRHLKQVTDWQEYGGAPILGLRRPCIKAHGRSSSRAVANAVKLAAKATRHDLPGAIAAGLAAAASLGTSSKDG